MKEEQQDILRELILAIPGHQMLLSAFGELRADGLGVRDWLSAVHIVLDPPTAFDWAELNAETIDDCRNIATVAIALATGIDRGEPWVSTERCNLELSQQELTLRLAISGRSKLHLSLVPIVLEILGPVEVSRRLRTLATTLRLRSLIG